MLKKEKNLANEDFILPQARNNEVVIQEMEDEVLIYDLKNDKAHHLNKTLSIIWKKCDGKTTEKGALTYLEKQLNTNIGKDFLWVAFDELEKVDLLKEKIKKENYTNLSRRKILFKYGLPTLAIPILMTLVIPAEGRVSPNASCLPIEANCNPLTMAPCCPGLFCNDFSGECEPIIEA